MKAKKAKAGLNPVAKALLNHLWWVDEQGAWHCRYCTLVIMSLQKSWQHDRDCVSQQAELILKEEQNESTGVR